MRHANGDIAQEVKGNGVIGEFPILTPGRPLSHRLQCMTFAPVLGESV